MSSIGVRARRRAGPGAAVLVLFCLGLGARVGAQTCTGNGTYVGCRGNGCYACVELLTSYPCYFTNHPSCLANSSCGGLYYTCGTECPTPSQADTCCAAGYKQCGGSCIPSTSCCTSGDCKSPPNGCYQAAGTCSGGMCSYAYNNGAACNADNDKCTPNDACQNGACIADTAHQVVCVQRDCHTAPSCNTTTGNCEDTALADGASCGANSCASGVGTCAGGLCSTAPKDCSALDTACQVGICDASSPVSSPCTTTNKVNGSSCTPSDLCQLQPSCNGGVCVGTPRSCTPSAACRTATCNPSTGGCEESVAPAGTSCAASNGCLQDPACDANGNCVGGPLADGTPCDLSGCASGTCVTGVCSCLQGRAPATAPGPAADASPSPVPNHGCGMTRASAARTGATWPAFLLLGLCLRRRRANGRVPARARS